MAQRMPPVPPAGRSPKGNTAAEQHADATDDKAKLAKHDERTRNLEQQGRQANIKQNTTNQGLSRG